MGKIKWIKDTVRVFTFQWLECHVKCQVRITSVWLTQGNAADRTHEHGELFTW